ncbi:hypothetical protein [Salibacterium sp. K-3]
MLLKEADIVRVFGVQPPGCWEAEAYRKRCSHRMPGTLDDRMVPLVSTRDVLEDTMTLSPVPSGSKPSTRYHYGRMLTT